MVGRLNYPKGSAPASRVHLYCKALKEAGGFPFVINLHSSFITPQKFCYSGRYEGIPFYYVQKSIMFETDPVRRNINKVKGWIRAFVIIQRLREKNNIKILFFSAGTSNEILFSLGLKILRIPVLRECNEAPLFIRYDRKYVKLNKFFLGLRFKLFDRIIVISDYLYNFYSGLYPAGRIFRIPILVDMDRFKNLKKNGIDSKKEIVYVGNISGEKDGLGDLIEAMAIVRKEIKNVKLILVGSSNEDDIIRLKIKISGLDLDDIVIFTGSKNAEEIPQILADSDLLVLARPDNSQAKAGFPTKLGEYLASGRPVVITTTGEIPRYLVDKESAYLAKPGDINDFASSVTYALKDLNAIRIGEAGRNVADKNFNYRLYRDELLRIIRFNNIVK